MLLSPLTTSFVDNNTHIIVRLCLPIFLICMLGTWGCQKAIITWGVSTGRVGTVLLLTATWDDHFRFGKRASDSDPWTIRNWNKLDQTDSARLHWLALSPLFLPNHKKIQRFSNLNSKPQKCNKKIELQRHGCGKGFHRWKWENRSEMRERVLWCRSEGSEG